MREHPEGGNGGKGSLPRSEKSEHPKKGLNGLPDPSIDASLTPEDAQRFRELSIERKLDQKNNLVGPEELVTRYERAKENPQTMQDFFRKRLEEAEKMGQVFIGRAEAQRDTMIASAQAAGEREAVASAQHEGASLVGRAMADAEAVRESTMALINTLAQNQKEFPDGGLWVVPDGFCYDQPRMMKVDDTKKISQTPGRGIYQQRVTYTLTDRNGDRWGYAPQVKRSDGTEKPGWFLIGNEKRLRVAIKTTINLREFPGTKEGIGTVKGKISPAESAQVRIEPRGIISDGHVWHLAHLSSGQHYWVASGTYKEPQKYIQFNEPLNQPERGDEPPPTRLQKRLNV